MREHDLINKRIARIHLSQITHSQNAYVFKREVTRPASKTHRKPVGFHSLRAGISTCRRRGSGKGGVKLAHRCGKRVAESVRSSGANGGTDSGEGLTAGVGCDKLLEIGKDVMI